MNRGAFDHAVRAAGAILGEDEILVIGSQALYGSVEGDLPPEAERSVEADIAALDRATVIKSLLLTLALWVAAYALRWLVMRALKKRGLRIEELRRVQSEMRPGEVLETPPAEPEAEAPIESGDPA